MARDLLTVQASTVAFESAFSISGRIISERRSRLTPESVEVCVCLKDYLDGVDRVQHETSLEGPILEDVEETIAREEVELGISPPNTELDECEFEDLDHDSRFKHGKKMVIVEVGEELLKHTRTVLWSWGIAVQGGCFYWRGDLTYGADMNQIRGTGVPQPDLTHLRCALTSSDSLTDIDTIQ
ncbi:zinc finger BED domain-containing protein RICESLEEPER 2 [Tanacetum coccineum]